MTAEVAAAAEEAAAMPAERADSSGDRSGVLRRPDNRNRSDRPTDRQSDRQSDVSQRQRQRQRPKDHVKNERYAKEN